MTEAIKPKHKWLITIAVMLAAMVEVLDLTIVNVALPHMMGSLGANFEQITWVLTSYAVSAAICMLLTGLLVAKYGSRKILLINITGFLLASMLCGLSNSLEQIVFFRMLQGIFGASLVPLSQFVLRNTFPPDEQSKAMAIWGIGIMVAPIMGPTLGGYITEASSWRWVFYINLPICLIAFGIAYHVIVETAKKKVSIDFFGLILMAIGIGALQIFLDQGNQHNWLESKYIQGLAFISLFFLIVFIIRGMMNRDNVINLYLFKDKNFIICTSMMAIFSIPMFGVMTILPILLENHMNYPSNTTGLVMAPMGIASAASMIIVSQLMHRIDPRILIIIGLCISSTGAYLMSQFDLLMGMETIIIACSFTGFGMGLFFVPLTLINLSTLPKSSIAEATGVFSFGRSIGSSIGISIFSTTLSVLTQTNWNSLGAHIQQNSASLQYWLESKNLTMDNPLAPQELSQELIQQASIVAFVDCFYMAMIIYLCIIPFISILKKPKISNTSVEH